MLILDLEDAVAPSQKDAARANFEIREADDPALADGQIRVANRFLSVEPAMRGWIADTGNYSAPVGINEVMRSLAVGEVIESRYPDYAVGEIVTGWFGWQGRSVVMRQLSSGGSPKPICSCRWRLACSASTASPRTSR